MRTLAEFFRSVYVPSCKDKSKRTLTEYNTAIRLVAEILDDPVPGTLGFSRDAFIRELRKRQLAAATINKHIRHVNAVLKQMGSGVPDKYTGVPAKWGSGVPAKWDGVPAKLKVPKIVSDADFQALYRAFGNETEYPKFIVRKHRPHYWRAIMHFVAVTALRREAVLGIEWCNVNTQERFLVLEPWIDKKDKRRYKPLTAELLDFMLELKGFGAVSGPKRHCVFPWVHGQKAWYECWNRAELAAGVKVGLHDLKRFSGELALRAGATELELMQHMDHANISTTLKHYCRPKTTDLVTRMKVPIPMEFEPMDPEYRLNTPEYRLNEAILADIDKRGNELTESLDLQRFVRLLQAGIDVERLESASRRSGQIWETSSGTILSVFDGETEVCYA